MVLGRPAVAELDPAAPPGGYLGDGPFHVGPVSHVVLAQPGAGGPVRAGLPEQVIAFVQDELAAAMRGGGLGLPDRTGHKEFGAVAAAWGVLEDLGVAAVIDEVAGPGPSGLPLQAGTYLALAALNRLVSSIAPRKFPVP